MVRPAVTIDLSGPLFERDPKQLIRGNIRRMLQGLAEQGEKAVQSLYPIGPTGHGRAGVKGRVASLTGRPWFLTAVVSQTHVYPWPGGGPKKYRGGKTEAKYHMFRRTKTAMSRSRAILSANLVRGLE
jgi:hypothetical protein